MSGTTSTLCAYIQANVSDKTGMFNIFIDYLLEAESAGQAVWLIQYVVTGGSTSYEGIPAPTDLWYQIVDHFQQYHSRCLFRHTHEDEFGLVYSNNATVKSAETAAVVSYIMPSVTTYQDLNAGFCYYLVDPKTFSVINYINCWANVSNTDAWTETGDATLEFEYSARETYDYNNTLKGNEPLSPAFWCTVAEDIAYNATTFMKYTDLRTKQYRPQANVTASERAYTICGLTSMSIPIFETYLVSMDEISSFLKKRTPHEHQH